MGAAPPMGGPRGAPNTTKNKVLSILDRARMAMDPLPPPPPAYPDYDDPAAYGQPAPHGYVFVRNTSTSVVITLLVDRKLGLVVYLIIERT